MLRSNARDYSNAKVYGRARVYGYDCFSGDNKIHTENDDSLDGKVMTIDGKEYILTLKEIE